MMRMMMVVVMMVMMRIMMMVMVFLNFDERTILARDYFKPFHFVLQII